MEPWKTILRLSGETASLLVTDGYGSDLLKARLPILSQHPRAPLWVLEGLALWSGSPLIAAVSVADRCPSSRASTFFGDDLWPAGSALVRFDGAPTRRPRARRLRGLGDFRQLRFRIGDGG